MCTFLVFMLANIHASLFFCIHIVVKTYVCEDFCFALEASWSFLWNQNKRKRIPNDLKKANCLCLYKLVRPLKLLNFSWSSVVFTWERIAGSNMEMVAQPWVGPRSILFQLMASSSAAPHCPWGSKSLSENQVEEGSKNFFNLRYGNSGK